MAEIIDTPVTFTVRRHAPELVFPAKPTPRELKPLSDIDSQEIFRCQIPGINFYRGDPKKNPASVIREALAKLLVFYYPLAGRLKEGPASKLIVDCTGEGVLFIEAEADATLNQLEGKLYPPMEQLLYDVPGSSGILDSPLLLIQVTRLICGGFILAVRANHAMSDAVGLFQFLKGLGEIARGATSPSTLPVWQRELLSSRDHRPHTPIPLRAHDQFTGHAIVPLFDMVNKTLFFTTTHISAIRKLVPAHLQSCSIFEVLTACIWRCRTIALQLDPEVVMPVVWQVNARRLFNPPLPVGYYGNVVAFSAAISTSRDLSNKPLSYALELVVKAKQDVNKRYIRSVDDIMAFKGWLHLTDDVRAYAVSDLTRTGLNAPDFGWWKRVYGGAIRGGVGIIPSLTSFYVPYTNKKGESGIVIPMCLPSEAMERFLKEVYSVLAQGKKDGALSEHKPSAPSKL